MERLVKFEIFGQEFSFHTDAPNEDIQEILELVKTQMQGHTQSTTLLPVKLAVLVSLNLAGKYVKLKREFERHKQSVDQEISSLADRIESSGHLE